MKKSLIALLLVVALVVTVSVFAVSAADPTQLRSDLTVDGDTATGYCPHCDQDVTWNKITLSATSHNNALSAGHWFMAEDVVSKGAIYNPAGDFVLHLNGHTYTRSEQTTGAIFLNRANKMAIVDSTAGTGGIATTDGGLLVSVNAAATLDVYSGDFTAAAVETPVQADGGMFDVLSAATINLYDTTISGGKASGNGGGFYVSAGAKITMKNGSVIENCTSLKTKSNTEGGGAVKLTSGSAVFTMETGSTIRNCTATASGAAVNTSAGTFNLAGGTIQNCSANGTGGAVFVSGSTAKINMTAGTIENCSAPTGGGIYVQYQSTQSTISGGTIKGCTATSNGGAIMLAGSGTPKMTMTGGTIIGSDDGATKNAGANGGAVYITASGVFELDGGTIKNIRTQTAGAVTATAGTSADVRATFIFKSGTIQDCVSLNNQGGVSIQGNAKLEMSGGTIDNCDSTYTGAGMAIGATSAQSTTAVAEITGGTIQNCNANSPCGGLYINKNATATVSGLTVKNCGSTSNDAGGVKVDTGATSASFTNCTFENNTAKTNGGNMVIAKAGVTLTNCTFTGGTAKNGGGLYVTAGDLTLSDGSFTGGVSNQNGDGGNIYWNSTGKLTVTGTALITKGTALRESGSSGGNGGNIAFNKGSFEMTGGTISGGLETNNANHAGNIYLGTNSATITGGTITGGKCISYGGNIYVYTGGKLDISGTATITNGKAAQGGNIYNRNGSTTITGADVNISGGTGTGNDIRTYGTSTTPGTVTLDGVSMVRDKNAGTINVGPYGKVNVQGETQVNSIRVEGESVGGVSVPATGAQVLIKEGFTGTAFVGWSTASVANAVVPGAATDPSLWQEAGYVGTGTVKVLNASSSSFNAADTGDAEGTDNKFVVAAYGGFKAGADGEWTETPLGNLDTAADYGYIKLYANGEHTLTCDTTFDLNNSDAHFITGNYKLTVIEYRTDALEVSKTTFTVDNEANLERYAVNPETGYQYVVVEEEDQPGEFSSNRVMVDIDSVSLKPATAGIYYTTKIGTNEKLAKYAVSYGVVLSLADMPAADFVTDLNADGLCENLYTEFDLEETASFSKTTNSALLQGILPEVAFIQNGVETTSGKAKIYANAFMCLNIDGEDIYVMADKTYDLSLLDILQIVDAEPSLAEHKSTIKMYDTWQSAMSAWPLPNIQAAWEKSKA